MKWAILAEQEPNVFVANGETFEGDLDEVQAHLSDLHDQTGVCHSADLIAE